MTGRTKLPNPRRNGEPITLDWIRSNCRVEVTAVPMTECWTWLGGGSGNGHGKIHFGGRKTYTHRVVLALVGVLIPSGMQVDHVCRNRACCNIAHLDIVTPRENVIRGVTSKAHIPNCTQCGSDEMVRYDNGTASGERRCLRCVRLRMHRTRAAKKAAMAARYG